MLTWLQLIALIVLLQIALKMGAALVRAVFRRLWVPRPRLPDVLLPENWHQWFADGRGNLRRWTWRRGRWHLDPGVIVADKEPAEP